METLGLYLLKSTIWMTGFTFIYWSLLRNERFFRLNRFFLLAGMLLSLALPLFSWHYIVEIQAPTQPSSPAVFWDTAPEPEAFPYGVVALLTMYTSGILFLAYRFYKQTSTIVDIIKNSETTTYKQIRLIRSDKAHAPFSFFTFVFVNPSIGETETNEIVHHELEHIRQRHWIDLLCYEFVRAIQWYNPFVWIYGRFIRQNHEYLADEGALKQTSNPAMYRAALLNQMFGGEVVSLAHSFNYSLNQKRFYMMKETIRSPFRKLKLLAVLPFSVWVFYAFKSPEYRVVEMPESQITVANQIDNIQKKDTTIQKELKVNGKITQVRIIPKEGQQDSLTDRTETKSKVVLRSSDQQAAPLYIVDGIEQKDGMDNVNQDNIESMSVLKGEAALATYGDKGKNGVIVVTSKKLAAIQADKNTDLKERVVVGHKITPPVIVPATSLSDNMKGVEEVVVVGYGSQAQKPATVSVRAASDKKVTPLIIVDGIATTAGIEDIKPNDIAMIEVLKDQAAVALYGSRAKDGVVIVTTKNGSEMKVKTEIPADSEDNSGKLTIVPNPTSGNTEARIDGINLDGQKKLSIFDRYGKKIKTTTFSGSSVSFSTSGLPTGNYYALVKSGKTQLTCTFVVAK